MRLSKFAVQEPYYESGIAERFSNMGHCASSMGTLASVSSRAQHDIVRCAQNLSCRDELVLITPLDFESDRLSRDEFLVSTLLLREHGSGSRRVVETAG